MLKTRFIGGVIAAAIIALIGFGPTPASAAETTPQLDRLQGKTLCGNYLYLGSAYTYNYQIPINFSKRFLRSTPVRERNKRAWTSVLPDLGKVFPLYNFSSQRWVPWRLRGIVTPVNPLLRGRYVQRRLNTALNRAGCERKFWIGGPKDNAALGTAPLLAGGPYAGRLRVSMVRTNGISFEGIQGPMHGATINFRIVRATDNSHFLNVQATGNYRALTLSDAALRDQMKSMALAAWQQFARNIEKKVN